MSNFIRLQIKQVIDRLPEEKLDDALKTMTEIFERPDYVQYYQGIPIMEPDNPLHMKRLLDMVNEPKPATPEIRPVLKLVDKE